MKKILLITFTFLIIFATISFADNSLTVKMDGEIIKFDVSPQVINSRTMVPVRAIFESFGSEVSWNEELKEVEAKKDSTIITLKIDSDVAIVNGKKILLDTPAKVINDRTFVPLRFISESLGANVKWIEETNTVEITSPEKMKALSEAKISNFKKGFPQLAIALEKSTKENYQFDLSLDMGIEVSAPELGLTEEAMKIKANYTGLYSEPNLEMTGLMTMTADNSTQEIPLSVVIKDEKLYTKVLDVWQVQDVSKVIQSDYSTLVNNSSSLELLSEIQGLIKREEKNNKLEYSINFDEKNINNLVNTALSKSGLESMLPSIDSQLSNLNIKVSNAKMKYIVTGDNLTGFEINFDIGIQNIEEGINVNMNMSLNGNYYDYGVQKEVEIPKF